MPIFQLPGMNLPEPDGEQEREEGMIRGEERRQLVWASRGEKEVMGRLLGVSEQFADAFW